MSNCQNTRELISQKLDGELNDIEQKQLNEHLASCSNCQKYYNNMIVIHEKLLNMPNITFGESIVDQLIDNNAFTFNGDLNQYKKRKWKPWAGAIAAALLIGIFLPYSLIYNQINDGQINMAEQSAEITAFDNNMNMSENLTKRSNNIEMDSATESGLGENDQFGLTLTATTKELMPFKIEEKENRLFIYKDDVELFRSNIWEDGLSVRWETINKNEIIYSLYSKDNNIVAKYHINLLEKNEEKIKE